jgi:hypothetical protein
LPPPTAGRTMGIEPGRGGTCVSCHLGGAQSTAQK